MRVACPHRVGGAEEGRPMADVNDFNAQIIEEFRANAGVVGGPFEGTTVLLLTTTGGQVGTRAGQSGGLPGRR